MEFRSRRDLKTTWGPAEPPQWATVVGLVDSASELELELIQSHMAQKPVLRGELRGTQARAVVGGLP